MYGVSNLLTRQETQPDGTPNKIPREGQTSKVLGCSRMECPDLWKTASPVNHITKDAPPFLILHGKADTTVDYEQSIELAENLRKAGVKNELILIEKAVHTFDLESTGTDLRPVVIGFFNKYLRVEK
jgi:dipeptidyl aminopeptidase/acylaminoacyl peptidase